MPKRCATQIGTNQIVSQIKHLRLLPSFCPQICTFTEICAHKFVICSFFFAEGICHFDKAMALTNGDIITDDPPDDDDDDGEGDGVFVLAQGDDDDDEEEEPEVTTTTLYQVDEATT